MMISKTTQSEQTGPSLTELWDNFLKNWNKKLVNKARTEGKRGRGSASKD